ncbi:MAG: SUMF1/EgtB/PvdO family nonheme iron enzyme [Pseudomonadota bacterium]
MADEAPVPVLSSIVEWNGRELTEDFHAIIEARSAASVHKNSSLNRIKEFSLPTKQLIARLQLEVLNYEYWPEVLAEFNIEDRSTFLSIVEQQFSIRRKGRVFHKMLVGLGSIAAVGVGYVLFSTNSNVISRNATLFLQNSVEASPAVVSQRIIDDSVETEIGKVMSSDLSFPQTRQSQEFLAEVETPSDELALEVDNTGVNLEGSSVAPNHAIIRLQTALVGLKLYEGELDGRTEAVTQRAVDELCVVLARDCSRFDRWSIVGIEELASAAEGELRIRAELERSAWLTATSEDNVEAYAEFLRSFPISRYTEQALSRIDSLIPKQLPLITSSPISAVDSRRIAGLEESPDPAGQIRVGGSISSIEFDDFPDARTSNAETVAPIVDFDPARLPDYAIFRECESCPEMVVLPTSYFSMGSPVGSEGRWPDEGPEQTVQVRRFAIGRYEITQDQWMACSSEDMCTENPGLAGSKYPVSNISWLDIENYIEYMDFATGVAGTYRRVTEAEWEYAARGGSKHNYILSDSQVDVCKIGNGADLTAKQVNESWATLDCDDGHYNPAPVGSFEPNSFGLFDTIGNVWEWVQDCYRDTLADQSVSGESYEADFCVHRTHRGGSWVDSPRNLRVTVRDRSASSTKNRQLGFRIARTL